MTRPLLICRPLPAAEATAAAALAMGMNVTLYPLFAIETCSWQPPDPTTFDALMLTSANAVRHGGPTLSRFTALRVFVVGEATGKAARTAGFKSIVNAGPDAQSMVETISKNRCHTILHLAGQDVRPINADALQIIHIPVYRAVERGNATGLSRTLVPAPVILLHSPRAAARLASLIAPDRRAHLTIIAISKATIDAAGQGWEQAHTAEQPDEGSMLALARQICQ